MEGDYYNVAEPIDRPKDPVLFSPGLPEVAEKSGTSEPELLDALEAENRKCNAGDQYSCCTEEALAREFWGRERARLVARDAQRECKLFAPYEFEENAAECIQRLKGDSQLTFEISPPFTPNIVGMASLEYPGDPLVMYRVLPTPETMLTLGALLLERPDALHLAKVAVEPIP